MKEFEDWFLSQYGKKPMPSPKNGDEPHTNTYMTMFADGANKGWQACQSINDKRIADLMAVIAKKDEALIKACELIEKFSLQVYNGSDCLMVYDAVELQPSDVELVAVAEVRQFHDTEPIFGRIRTLVDISCEPHGTKLYTIKTKE